MVAAARASSASLSRYRTALMCDRASWCFSEAIIRALFNLRSASVASAASFSSTFSASAASSCSFSHLACATSASDLSYCTDAHRVLIQCALETLRALGTYLYGECG